MKVPGVSVVTVAFNAAEVLPIVLKSIKKQDYSNFEMILVDGRSTDDTVKVARSYGCRIVDNPQRYAETGRYLGALSSRKEYVAYVDSDNELASTNWLTHMMKPLIENHKLAGSFCLYHPNPYHYFDESPMNTYYSLLGNDPVSWYLGGLDHHNTKGYEIFDFSYVEYPLDLALANGTIVKRHLIISFEWNDDIYPLQKLAEDGLRFACVYDVFIHHHHLTSFGSFIKKYITRARYRNLYRNDIIGSRLETRRKRLQQWLLYSLTFVPPCYDTVKLYRRTPSKAWLVHPLACFIETMIYSLVNRVRVF